MILYHGTFHKFHRFTITNDSIGIHFGTLDQARARVSDKSSNEFYSAPKSPPTIIEVSVAISRPLRIGDCGSWDERDVANELIDAGFDEKRVENATTMTALRTLIKDAGYDSIVYKNDVEIPNLDDILEKRDKAWAMLRNPSLTPTERRKYQGWVDQWQKTRSEASDSYIVFDPERIRVTRVIPAPQITTKPKRKSSRGREHPTGLKGTR